MPFGAMNNSISSVPNGLSERRKAVCYVKHLLIS